MVSSGGNILCRSTVRVRKGKKKKGSRNDRRKTRSEERLLYPLKKKWCAVKGIVIGQKKKMWGKKKDRRERKLQKKKEEIQKRRTDHQVHRQGGVPVHSIGKGCPKKRKEVYKMARKEAAERSHAS